MKAIVRKEYGSSHVLHLEEIEKPVPGACELLVIVRAASVNWLDWHFLTGKPFLARIMAGLLKPKNSVLGIDVAGRVEAVGSNVTQFQTGDEVFGASTHGCFAEYVSVSEDAVVAKPPTKKDLIFIKELLDSGEIVPVIDRCYPLPELPDAFRYLEKGHARGKVVIVI